ncbi:hypothetical protein G647_09864 [Cladophialophora carrionii CBS 160.54]|uniref:Xylanolytic transcriptional activator regulatory domain-containing protein n=1 Tax=Cladophialophora carrionii CBS 160.54 TaxID=1279043 RepID=V9DKE8_9EURO|nr:uncharacterized protein G647_09864 [Cladophialophora carrionii CBS 160.54]ETI27181.1 hypothetical protein G647_09864 [Cladophialophora carrionii CBS 160.54]
MSGSRPDQGLESHHTVLNNDDGQYNVDLKTANLDSSLMAMPAAINDVSASEPSQAGIRESFPEESWTHSHDSGAGDASPEVSLSRGYMGESGFMQIFRQGQTTTYLPTSSIIPGLRAETLSMSPLLLQAFEETHHEYCYPFCPILDKLNHSGDDPFAGSVLLQQALAVLGTRVNPPVIQHDHPSLYYRRAKTLFYMSHEPNPLIRIIAIIFLQWWSAGPPNVVSLDSQYFWTGVAIRLAHEIGLYREPTRNHSLKLGETFGLRRRIFWALFARERVFSLCQGRPCLVHLEDCDIQQPTLTDFPADQAAQGEIFIHYVRLSEIIGRLSRRLSLGSDRSAPALDIIFELQNWVQSLPQHLLLPFGAARTATRDFRRDVHQLHLPYLTAIMLLYMNSSSHALPKASATALLAASCVARIFQDFLARGSINFVSGIGGWYMTVAILALLHGSQIPALRDCANEQIDVLMIALREIAKSWYSAEMFLRALEKHVKGQSEEARGNPSADTLQGDPGTTSSAWSDLASSDGVDLLGFFPGHTAQTSKLFGVFYADEAADVLMNLAWPADFSTSVMDLFDQTFEGMNGTFGFPAAC